MGQSSGLDEGMGRARVMGSCPGKGMNASEGDALWGHSKSAVLCKPGRGSPLWPRRPPGSGSCQSGLTQPQNKGECSVQRKVAQRCQLLLLQVSVSLGKGGEEWRAGEGFQGQLCWEPARHACGQQGSPWGLLACSHAPRCWRRPAVFLICEQGALRLHLGLAAPIW